MYVCMSEHMYVCMYMQHIYVCMQLCMCVCMQLYMYVCIDTWLEFYVYVAYICMYVAMYVAMYVCMYVAYICMYVQIPGQNQEGELYVCMYVYIHPPSPSKFTPFCFGGFSSYEDIPYGTTQCGLFREQI